MWKNLFPLRGTKPWGINSTDKKMKSIQLKESLPYEIQEEAVVEEIEVNQPEAVDDDEAPQTKLDF